MLYIDKQSKEAYYMQIYGQLRDSILSGELEPGHILTGSRVLSKKIGVGRNTVDNAYAQLTTEGYIYAKKGVGFVVRNVPEIELLIDNKAGQKKEHSRETISKTDLIRYNLSYGDFSGDLFPSSMWKKYTHEGLTSPELKAQLNTYQQNHGDLYLRRQLVSYLARARGVHCREEQIIITSGFQQSLEYICKLLCFDNRASVLMEEPGYDKARAVFDNNRVPLHTVPVGEYGAEITALPDSNEVKAMYVTPSHQFPTGFSMPIGHRYELLKWAEHTSTYIIEDDYDSVFRYDAAPIPSLQSIDHADQVIYLGTFSKTLSPTIRMGYMVLPEKLLSDFYSRFRSYYCTVPWLSQFIVGRMIENGHYERHIRKVYQLLRKKHDLFSKELTDMCNKIRLSSQEAGQYFVLEFPEGMTQEWLMERALEQGVQIYSTLRFWNQKESCPPNTLFLGFSSIDLADIKDCVARLKRAWFEKEL